MAYITQLKNTTVKRTTYEGRDPIWEAVWVHDGIECGYSATRLRTLIDEVLAIQQRQIA